MTEPTNINDHRPHVAAPVRCLACRHKWVAVAPADADLTALVCPNCDTPRSIHQA